MCTDFFEWRPNTIVLLNLVLALRSLYSLFLFLVVIVSSFKVFFFFFFSLVSRSFSSLAVHQSLLWVFLCSYASSLIILLTYASCVRMCLIANPFQKLKYSVTLSFYTDAIQMSLTQKKIAEFHLIHSILCYFSLLILSIAEGPFPPFFYVSCNHIFFFCLQQFRPKLFSRIV